MISLKNNNLYTIRITDTVGRMTRISMLKRTVKLSKENLYSYMELLNINKIIDFDINVYGDWKHVSLNNTKELDSVISLFDTPLAAPIPAPSAAIDAKDEDQCENSEIEQVVMPIAELENSESVEEETNGQYDIPDSSTLVIPTDEETAKILEEVEKPADAPALDSVVIERPKNNNNKNYNPNQRKK